MSSRKDMNNNGSDNGGDQHSSNKDSRPGRKRNNYNMRNFKKQRMGTSLVAEGLKDAKFLASLSPSSWGTTSTTPKNTSQSIDNRINNTDESTTRMTNNTSISMLQSSLEEDVTSDKHRLVNAASANNGTEVELAWQQEDEERRELPQSLGPPQQGASKRRRESDGIEPMSMKPHVISERHGTFPHSTLHGVEPVEETEEREIGVSDILGGKMNVPENRKCNGDKHVDVDDDEADVDPTICSLILKKFSSSCGCWCCCGNRRKEGRKNTKNFTTSMKQKAYDCCAFILWITPIMLGLYVTIVNIGATAQSNVVRDKLPAVHKALYATMDEGPVCAYNKDDGMSVPPMTFPDKDAAHDAGYLILHCGACGGCSDWHNLRLEYTTRNFLAKESAKCARKSLLGGADAVQECLEAPEPINFLGKCAECWTTDILCTKKHCSLIFLQSTLINTVSNFKVNNETITSASC